MNRMSPEARALLEGVRAEFEATDEDCARIDRALTARLGLAAGALVGATSATTVSAASAGATGTTWAAASATTAAVAAKWVAGALLVASAAAGGRAVYRAVQHAPTPAVARESADPRLPTIRTTSPASSPSSGTTVPSGAGDPSESEYLAPAMGLPIAARARTAPSPQASRSPAATNLGEMHNATLGAETQILSQADHALRAGDATRALALLDEHARRFPDGVLAEERSAERVSTLCALGRVDQARAEAALFVATRSGSPLEKVVRQSCGGDGSGRTHTDP